VSVLHTLMRRARQFGLRRSVAVYLLIVVGLVLASELAIEHLIGQESAAPGMSILNALAIAALVGVFVFFLFHGAVEDRERAGAALADSEERFRSLTALSADWFWESDPDHRLNWIAGGHSMLKLFGSSLAYGQRLWEIGGIEVASPALEAHLAALGARRAFHDLELCRPGGAGGPEYHLISGEPKIDPAGRFRGYRGVGRSITETRNAEKALSGAMERLEMALDSGALAIWDSDIPAGRLFVSGGWAHMIGEPADSRSRTLEEMTARIHAQDREGAILASRCAVKGETPSFSAELRIRTASGDWKWVVSSGRVVERDESGRAVRMTGTVVDIDRRKRAEHAVRDAEMRYRTLVDLSPDAVLLHSDGRIEYANRAAADMLGVAGPAGLIGRETRNLAHSDDRAMVEGEARYLRAEFRERRMLRQDGSVAMVEGASVSYLERGRLVVQTVLRDISERVRSRQELAEREQRFRDVVEAAGEYVWETDAGFRYTWLSDRIEAVLGYVRADLLGRRPQEFMPLGEARTIEERLEGHRSRVEPFRDLVHRSITKSGRVIWQSMTGVPVFDAGGALKGYRGTGTDVTAKRQAEERIQFLATRDALTGLPDRLLLADRATQAILNAGRNKGRLAVLSLQLDRWRLVNDSLGHRVDDAVIRAAAERVSSTLRKDDTLARLGGDEFVMLWDGTRQIEDVALVAQKALAALATPIVVEGRVLSVSASVGISVYPGDGLDFVELVKNADAARFAAHESGGNTIRFFSREFNTRALVRLEMENDLHRAIARDEFVLQFQPVVRAGGEGTASGVVGAEILLHWRHPAKGMLPPGEFLPLAEKCGLAGVLATLLVEQACGRIAAWREGPLARLWFSLNVPTKTLSKDRGFAATLEKAMRDNGLVGERLALVLAERSMQHEGSEHLDMLRAIAGLGIALTVDELGTGQFDLGLIRQMPVGKLKIDRRLVADIATREDAAIVVQTFAAMARALGLAFAAEGVENAAQLARLEGFGCDEWQGSLYSEPLDAAAFERFVAAQQRAAAA